MSPFSSSARFLFILLATASILDIATARIKNAEDKLRALGEHQEWEVGSPVKFAAKKDKDDSSDLDSSDLDLSASFF